MSFYQEFAKQYARLTIQPAISDVLVYIIKLGNATAEDFDRAIETHWSIVEMLLQMPQEELKAFISEIPSASGVGKFAPLFLGDDPSAGIDILASLDLQEIAGGVSNELPQHAEILKKNLPWLKQELSKLKDVLLALRAG